MISSFNYIQAEGLQLSNQDYTICIRYTLIVRGGNTGKQETEGLRTEILLLIMDRRNYSRILPGTIYYLGLHRLTIKGL